LSANLKLAPVIEINKEKCINCYTCITACPVKYCMDGSGEKLTINHDMCIGCGNCIDVCSHDARNIIDDTDRFLNDLKRGEKIITITAPATASVFPGNYLKLNGYLKSLGVETFFDVSFGAELTVYSYVNYIKNKKTNFVISQPCPAIVSFIEIYYPELIPYLAPADSPMLHIMKMIREYFPVYRYYKIAVISPCIAKKREFDETGIGDYNVTMRGLKKHIELNKINLGSFPPVEFYGPRPERGVTFSSPGGLLDTAERFIPGIRRDTRKIEGVHTIYDYLKSVSANLHKPGITFPLLIDCLNCEMGCNGGPGTGNHGKSMDELESPVRKRSKELEDSLDPKHQGKKFKKYHELLGKYWKPGLYNRTYVDRKTNYILKRPNEKELDDVYHSMKKFNKHDIYDCTACGYGSCQRMATAIFNKLNKPGNCAHYTLALLGDEKKTTVYINNQLKIHINRALVVIEKINDLVMKLNETINIQSDSVNESSAVTEKIVSSLKSTSDLSKQKRESLKDLIVDTEKGRDSMKETIQAVQNIAESVDGIASAIRMISVIASNTNLLSMNAAIEAAHAGNAGKGFAVVADEIRRLSETTRENSRNISQTLSNIISGINDTSKRTNDTGAFINDMSGEIGDFTQTMTELIDTLSGLSNASTEITNSLQTLRGNSAAVKDDYSVMLSLTDKLRYDINYLAAMSADIVKAIEENDQDIITRLIAMEEKSSQQKIE